MNLKQTAQLLAGHLAPLVQAAYPDMVVLWDNDGQERPTDDKAFCRVSIKLAGDAQAALGKSVWSRAGTVYVQVFTPKGQGDADALDIAGQFMGWLRGLTLDYLQFYGVDYDVVGEREAFFQINIEAQFKGLTA